MSDKLYSDPEQLSGYTGEQEPHLKDQPGSGTPRGSDLAKDNRGKPAARDGSGSAQGSGASAGGGGGPEQYDSDPQAGGGSLSIQPAQDAPAEGGDGAKHGSR
jgi:hypothetical protein